MLIKISQKSGATVVELQGALDAANCETVLEEMMQLLQTYEVDALVLDLEGMKAPGVPAVRFLLGALVATRAWGPVLTLAGVKPQLDAMLRLTGARELFSGFASSEQAALYGRRLAEAAPTARYA